ncbi:hypothetical protein [Lawsonibacter sp. JLR.KK007]|jgi:hypothetical protein|uniref:hypothetical protein n=1 Tax=Lawsonibacter sp. JLR.KK007 TaxID=3114293 RepID=UPI002FF1D56A
MKTKEEILNAKKSSDVWRWIVAAPSPLDSDPDVLKYFEELREKELREYIGPDYDPEMHYDFLTRKKKENDD